MPFLRVSLNFQACLFLWKLGQVMLPSLVWDTYLPVAPMTRTLVFVAWGVSKSSELPEMLPRVSKVSVETVVLPGALRFENRFHTDSSTALHIVSICRCYATYYEHAAIIHTSALKEWQLQGPATTPCNSKIDHRWKINESLLTRWVISAYSRRSIIIMQEVYSTIVPCSEHAWINLGPNKRTQRRVSESEKETKHKAGQEGQEKDAFFLSICAGVTWIFGLDRMGSDHWGWLPPSAAYFQPLSCPGCFSWATQQRSFELLDLLAESVPFSAFSWLFYYQAAMLAQIALQSLLVLSAMRLLFLATGFNKKWHWPHTIIAQQRLLCNKRQKQKNQWMIRWMLEISPSSAF